MLQQIIALMIILYFLSRLAQKKKQDKIGANEYRLWLVFWSLVALAVIFIKKIDSLVAKLGFSGSGIEILLYLGVAILFYFVFRLRIKLAGQDKYISILTREVAILKENKKNES